MRRFGWCVLSCLVAVTAAAAPDDKLSRAQKLFDDLDVEAASKVLEAVAAEGKLGRAGLLQFYALQGLIRATLNRGDVARDSFYRLLLLDPTWVLPKNQPPRVRTAFFEAKGMAIEHGPLTAEGKAEVEPGGVKRLTVTVQKDVLRMARAVVFVVKDEAGPRSERVELQEGVASLPVAGSSVRWHALVLGERENVLLEVGSAEAPLEVNVPAPEAGASPAVDLLVTQPAPRSQGAWKQATGFTLLGAGAAAGVAGLILGARSQSLRESVLGAARDERGVIIGLTQREAVALEGEARGSAFAANVLFVSAGAAAAVGLGLLLWGALEQPVVLAPGPGGVVVHGAF